MLSWRYLDHPAAGGAEMVTHEVLRRLAAYGHAVTCFTAAYPGAAAEGELDGVRVLRRGGQPTVHLHAWRWLRARRDEFDRVVDQVNTIPFLTPLYVARDRRRLLIMQLAREYWFRETRGAFRAVAPLGYLAEPWYLRTYRSTPVITISRSSADDLMRLGVGRAGITIIPMALPTEPLASLEPKSGPWRVIVLGRLTQAKFVEEALDAFDRLRRAVPEARLDIVGEGDPAYRRRLESHVARDGISAITFHGRVDAARKDALLQRAHVHLFCSHREGWGLTVTEAAAMGTPSIGYDVPGVRDSVASERLLAPVGDTAALAARMLELHRDRPLYDRLRREAWERTRALSYNATTEAFAAALSVDWQRASP
jgi:glycosyltransferase involved in cell wall biosynthesis